MENNKYPILSIDVSKGTLDVCVKRIDGTSVVRCFRGNDPSTYTRIFAWLQKSGIERATVILESTGCYSLPVTLFFYELHWTVYLVNPATTHAAAGGSQRRTKTDRVDAKALADYLEGSYRTLRSWQPLPERYQVLRTLVRELQQITQDLTRVKNRIEKVPYLCEEARNSVNGRLQQQKEFLTDMKKTILAELRCWISQDQEMMQRFNRLQTVPGCGEKLALLFMSEIPDPTKYKSGQQIAAQSGLTPRIRHSGKHTPISQPISRVGSTHLRRGLYLGSLSAAQYNPVLRPVALRLREKGKKPKVVQVAIARKLAVLLFAIDKYKVNFDASHKSSTNINASNTNASNTNASNTNASNTNASNTTT